MDGQKSILSHATLYPLAGHTNAVNSVAWSPDGAVLASGSSDSTIRLWDGRTGVLLHSLEGHVRAVNSVAWSPDGAVLASGSSDKTVRLWNGQTGALLHTLKSHTDAADSMVWSPEGQIFGSKFDDHTVHLWRTRTWETVEFVEGVSSSEALDSLYFSPHAPLLATLDKADTAVHIWHVDVTALLSTTPVEASIHYTTAKIALVGDSSVGKSGLGYRLAENRFQLTESTHGQQFWIVDELGTVRDDGTLCEAILWDFAGQPNFRPIHALFLENIDLALVLFDPARADTLTGVDFWLKHLGDKHHSCCTILVAARIDVSPLSLSYDALQSFCRDRKISGGFVATSAKLNQGIDTLLNRIRQQIEWYTKPAIVTTQTFKRIKDYVLELKVRAERPHVHVLVSPALLRQQLEEKDPDWRFSDEELMVAIGHLQNQGYVTILRRSSI